MVAEHAALGAWRQDSDSPPQSRPALHVVSLVRQTVSDKRGRRLMIARVVGGANGKVVERVPRLKLERVNSLKLLIRWQIFL